ncbi:MAG: vitamin B12 dependent-methionine synthase activation domain-containing protein [candidate division WOR-3 bacterium]
MRTVVRFKPEQCLPNVRDVFAAEGMSGIGPTSTEVTELVEEARALFRRLATPVGVYADIAKQEFDKVFLGEGRNAADAVLTTIYPRATHLALFAGTVGASLSDEIRLRFERHDYALAYVLDATASAGTERLADLLQESYRVGIGNQRSELGDSAVCNRQPGIVLRYSPGYCGWHVSGQRRLFGFLLPEEIGITLRESFLMEPLKSVSGVFVCGPAEIHRFEAGFSYCAECRDPGCRKRIAALDEQKQSDKPVKSMDNPELVNRE